MKVYELVFMDMERGKIKRWKRNKREITTFANAWKREHPLRQLMTTKLIEIPDDKTGLIDWLNDNCGGVNT